MLFSSQVFIFAFLPVALIGFHLLRGHRRLAGAWLTILSLIFYGYWDAHYLPLIITVIILNYTFGIAIATSPNERRSRSLMILGIAGNLAILAYYKYTNFFLSTVSSATGLSFAIPHIVMPLGISFFTFQKIAYLADCYKHKTCDRNFLDYSLFVLFFPQLIAGPIVHHAEVLPQLKNLGDKAKAPMVLTGFATFFAGLIKKCVLADSLASYGNPLFARLEQGTPLGLWASWAAILLYAFQLYFDFSGYSDMAVGLARMFGIRLPWNFDSPYKSTSIVDFWRRWHITLSRFLRDYLYIPLGGSRKGNLRRYLNLGATMALGGLWHGASWNFVIWGILHGLYLVVNHLWRASDATAAIRARWQTSRSGALVCWALTFLCVLVGWVFFRCESLSSAFGLLRGMAGLHGLNGMPEPRIILWILAAAYIALFCKDTVQWVAAADSHLDEMERSPLRFRPYHAAILGVLTFFALKTLFEARPTEFLYFNF